MTTHTLRLVYDGLGSTQHKMPPSLEKQITVGSQEFLGAHAYFFTGVQQKYNLRPLMLHSTKQHAPAHVNGTRAGRR